MGKITLCYNDHYAVEQAHPSVFKITGFSDLQNKVVGLVYPEHNKTRHELLGYAAGMASLVNDHNWTVNIITDSDLLLTALRVEIKEGRLEHTMLEVRAIDVSGELHYLYFDSDGRSDDWHAAKVFNYYGGLLIRLL